MANPKMLPCDAAAIRAVPGSAACAARRRWVLVAAVLGSTLAFVDESVVNVALPKMESDLHTTLAAMQWVINAYTLCMSALLLIGGATADQFGRRRVFLIGVVVFAVASLGCGLAPDVQILIGALDRHAAHRNVLAEMLSALGQHDAECTARDFGIPEKQLVEIAHPVEQEAVRIGGFDLDVLLHHRRDAAVVGRGAGVRRSGARGFHGARR